MTAPTVPAPRDNALSPRLRALHVSALCAFAFTEPILSALSAQAVYRHDQKMGWIEFGAVLIVLTLAVPLIAVVLDRLAEPVSHRCSGWGRNAVLFGLGCLVLLSLLRPTARLTFLSNNHFAWLFSLGCALPGGWLFARFYERSSGLRQWVTVSALGLIVFPMAFVWSMYGELTRQRETAIRQAVTIRNPVPLIMVVFDEFSGTTLMNERLEIDAARYPNFARLSELSTWYRRATTVHTRTDIAVPAILTGRFPTERRAPVEAEHSGNLLQLIHRAGDHDMVVFEPITRLAPAVLNHTVSEMEPSRMQRVSDVLSTLTTVYPRLIFPKDTPLNFPPIPKAWFGAAEQLPESNRPLRRGRIHYVINSSRAEQQDHFLDCLYLKNRPLFCFFHVLLPHYPWTFYPSGRHYVRENYEAAPTPEGGLGELGETWPTDEAVVLRSEHRYLLQVAYVDRFIGRLLDKLETTGLLDRCMLVVMADHGVSFRPGRSRRVPDAENIADILSVPLFIKRPGQTSGAIDDRNVESVDVLPTIAEELGISLAEPVDGTSVATAPRRLRKTIYFENGMTVVEPQIPQLEAAVQRRLSIFGHDSLEKPPSQTANRPDWYGRPLAGFKIEAATPGEEKMIRMSSPKDPMNAGSYSTRLIAGRFSRLQTQGEPVEVALAVNGVLQDTCQVFQVDSLGWGFSFLLPESLAWHTPAQVELFLVKSDMEGSIKLARLRQWTLKPWD